MLYNIMVHKCYPPFTKHMTHETQEFGNITSILFWTQLLLHYLSFSFLRIIYNILLVTSTCINYYPQEKYSFFWYNIGFF